MDGKRTKGAGILGMSDGPRALVRLTVKPGAKVPGIAWTGDGWVLRVRERAIEGAANEACIAALARILGVAPSKITLVRGRRSRAKTFAIEGLDDRSAGERLATPS